MESLNSEIKMGILIEEKSIELNNSGMRNLTIIIVFAAAIVDFIIFSLALQQGDGVSELLSLVFEDIRFLGLFSLPFIGLIYLLLSKRRIIGLNDDGIFCSSFNGMNNVRFTWSQVSSITHENDWITFHFDDNQSLTLLPIEYMISNDTEKVENAIASIIKFAENYFVST